jgi:hypothetical protein
MNASYEERDGYLYVKVRGEFNLSSARDVFFEWVEKARSCDLDVTLCDITLVTGLDDQQVSTRTLFNACKFIGGSIPVYFRLAILETPQQRTNDQFGENIMVNSGAKVKVTSNLNEALKWLGVTDNITSH